MDSDVRCQLEELRNALRTKMASMTGTSAAARSEANPGAAEANIDGGDRLVHQLDTVIGK